MITFKSLDAVSSFCGHTIFFKGIRVKFAYECHWVKLLIHRWSCLRLEGILVVVIIIDFGHLWCRIMKLSILLIIILMLRTCHHDRIIARAHPVHLVSAVQLPCLRPSQPTWAVSPPVGCYHCTHHDITIYYYSARKPTLVLLSCGG